MSKSSESSVPVFRACTATVLLCAVAWAKDRLSEPSVVAGAAAPGEVRDALDAPADGLLYDEVEGAHWVRGTAYKASFGADGTAIVPFFGSDAPRNYPLALRAGATLGGMPIPVLADGPTVRISRSDSTAEIDHGGFVEQYLLTPRTLEQRFVFESLEGEGELVVRLELESELAATDLGSTLRFENDLGRIDYGEAFAFDADGNRIALDSRLAGGAIELVVPADFVAAAALPLTIDPLVTFATVGSIFADEIEPDLSYDVSTDRWCSVWTVLWSQSDHDVIGRLVDGNGTAWTTTLPIDVTAASWTRPRIANHNSTNKFLVVASAAPGGVWGIHGRLVLSNSASLGSPVQISPQDGIHRTWAGVGGSSDPIASGFFCVVWQRLTSAGNVDIEGRLVTSEGFFLSNLIPIDSSPASHAYPSISSSSGKSQGTGTTVWTVVWQHEVSGSNDIYGAQIEWDGTLRHPMFPISQAPTDEGAATVSMVLDPAASSGPERPYMVVFQRRFATHNDIVGVVMQGATVLQSSNLSAVFETPWMSLDQTNAVVESDGYGFLVGYDERATLSSTDIDVRISAYNWGGGNLQPCAVHEGLAASTRPELDLSLHSQASSGGPTRRYGGAYESSNTTSGYDTHVVQWDGCVGGLVRSACAGDGSSGACPCGNDGAAGHGCANSAVAAGALLSWTGDASVSADTLTLDASGLPSSASCLFFQSASLASGGIGQPFGDGLRCAVGPSIRLGLFSAVGGAVSYPSPGGLPVSARGLVPGVGGTRYYQAWYRDPASFCTTTTFNVTNAIEVNWAP